jgi:O6-methylguanine-DNA--protein-cysteine methyltransferase
VEQSPIFVKTYAFVLWLQPLAANFPRHQRAGLARRLEDSALNFYERILEAGKSKSDPRLLRAADLELDKVRFYLRMSKDLKSISLGQYAHAAELVVEIGKLLGGWMKRDA